MDKQKVGFIQGVAYAASMVKQYGFDAYDLIKESGISVEEFRNLADETDFEILKEIFEDEADMYSSDIKEL